MECTVNRVGDCYFQQCLRNGHHRRIEDLERFASLGIRALRYPVLWEVTAPEGLERADWAWTDARLQRLRELRVRPIVGLVHHGSGPRHTSLLDPGFPAGLATFAAAVARRYPWLTDFTPVNEPLTTARFSALYGHWYPHKRDSASFACALVTQCRAIVEAMCAIREVIPHARLVHTDDAGSTYSTPTLAYQAEFENERRWLSFDLVSGRVDRAHPLWGHLVRWGIPEADLEFFLAHPTPPDVVGLNYYLTSDRWLDEKIEHYPPWSHGGNERDTYADVEAVRVRPDGIAGHLTVLRAAWERYRLPVALTEVHLGCTREEQLRWLLEAWEAARTLRAGGADIRAVTVWSLLGAYDWDSLVTADRGSYEPGAWDLRGAAPRPTAIVSMTRALATHGRFEHPVLEARGWWRRPIRMWPGRAPATDASCAAPHLDGKLARPLMIIGSTGTLGRAFARLCELRGIRHVLLGRREVDIASPDAVDDALERHAPWAVVNAAGYVRVDAAEQHIGHCFRENTQGALVLAKACRHAGVQLVTFSSDLVFSGEQKVPYVESSSVGPLNIYGRSKVLAEELVLASLPGAFVVRSGAFFGPWDVHNFATQMLSSLARMAPVVAANDTVVSPTYVPDLVHACLDLLIDGEEGVRHLATPEPLTWYAFAQRLAEHAELDPERIQGLPMDRLALPALRPTYSALGTERGNVMPGLDDAVRRYLAERQSESALSQVPSERSHEAHANVAFGKNTVRT